MIAHPMLINFGHRCLGIIEVPIPWRMLLVAELTSIPFARPAVHVLFLNIVRSKIMGAEWTQSFTWALAAHLIDGRLKPSTDYRASRLVWCHYVFESKVHAWCTFQSNTIERTEIKVQTIQKYIHILALSRHWKCKIGQNHYLLRGIWHLYLHRKHPN